MTNLVIHLIIANLLGPKLEPDLNGGMSHTASVYVSLKNRLPNARLGPLEQLVNLLNPKHLSGCALFNPPLQGGPPIYL